MPVRDRVISFALKFSDFFEPFAKFGVSYYVKRQLKLYKEQGAIDAYKAKVRRLGKWHYRVEVNLDLTSSQTTQFAQKLGKIIRGLGR